MIVEVVHTAAEAGEHGSHWARIKGDNGEIVWVTEQYTAAETAHEAIELLEAGFGGLTAAGVRNFEIVDVWE